MTLSHHLDDASLLAYASGTMPKGMALLVDCHIDRCEACLENVRSAEAIGGQLLDSIEPVSVEVGAFELLLSRLVSENNDQARTTPEIIALASAEVPAPLARLVGTDLDKIAWKKMGGGVQQFDLALGGIGAARLLRIQPGASVPQHTHTGNELTMILRGSYSDEVGRFRVGDVADLDDRINHQPIVDTHQECICLIATDAPLKFTGLMGRLVQPFIGL